MNKNFLVIILVCLCLVLTLQNVLAIGITPGRTTLDFEPNLQKQVSFSITNSEHKDMNVKLYVKGELKDKITLDQEEVYFSSQDDSKSFLYAVNLPESFDRPGLHVAEIVALEVPKEEGIDGTVVGATVAVITQLYVYVPYPGKYLEAELNILETNSGHTTTFLVPLTNRGKENIENAKAIIQIYSNDNELIDEVDTGSIRVLVGERKELIGNWDADVEEGLYKAKVILTYDGEEKILEKEFSVGEAKLEIELITVKDFRLGEIAKFNILVNNKWGEEIKDVSVNMLVFGDERDTIADFKSPNYDISATSKMEMIAYWDTEGVQKGLYDGKLILRYGENKNEKNVQVKISDYSLEVIGVTGRVIVKGEGGYNLTNILIIVIVLLVLANLVWFLIVKRLKKRRTK